MWELFSLWGNWYENELNICKSKLTDTDKSGTIEKEDFHLAVKVRRNCEKIQNSYFPRKPVKFYACNFLVNKQSTYLLCLEEIFDIVQLAFLISQFLASGTRRKSNYWQDMSKKWQGFFGTSFSNCSTAFILKWN